jgi:hypothetical protein
MRQSVLADLPRILIAVPVRQLFDRSPAVTRLVEDAARDG